MSERNRWQWRLRGGKKERLSHVNTQCIVSVLVQADNTTTVSKRDGGEDLSDVTAAGLIRCIQ